MCEQKSKSKSDSANPGISRIGFNYVPDPLFLLLVTETQSRADLNKAYHPKTYEIEDGDRALSLGPEQ